MCSHEKPHECGVWAGEKSEWAVKSGLQDLLLRMSCLLSTFFFQIDIPLAFGYLHFKPLAALPLPSLCASDGLGSFMCIAYRSIMYVRSNNHQVVCLDQKTCLRVDDK